MPKRVFYKHLLEHTIFFYHDPTNPFTILEHSDQEIGEFYVVQERRATDFEALKMWKGRSGRDILIILIFFENVEKMEFVLFMRRF